MYESLTLSYISWTLFLTALVNTFVFPFPVRLSYSFLESSQGQSCHISLFPPEPFSQGRRESYNWPVAEAIIYVCPLLLLTATSSGRCQPDVASSRELNTAMAEEALGWGSRLRSFVHCCVPTHLQCQLLWNQWNPRLDSYCITVLLELSILLKFLFLLICVCYWEDTSAV